MGSGTRGTTAGRWAVAATAAALALAGCGGDGDGAAADGPGPATTASTTTTVPADLLEPAGEPMVDALVVPAGTGLAGVFSDPTVVDDQPAGAGDPWTAYLVVRGDPFAAWDDLAGQLRAVGVPLAGSADACLWTVDPAETTAVPETSPAPEAVPVPAGPGEPVGAVPDEQDRATADRRERERFDARRIGTEPPPAGTDGVSCYAIAEVDVDGIRTEHRLDLTAATDVPATLQVGVRRWTNPGRPPRTAAQVTDHLAQAQGAEREVRSPRPDAVPADAATRLPTIAAQPEVAVGQEFGTSVNCFDAPTDRFRLPADARLVADGFDARDGSVLVLDPDRREALLDEFEAQAAGPAPTSDFAASRHDARLADGSTVTRLDLAILAGGGSCSFTSSADGSRLLVHRHAD